MATTTTTTAAAVSDGTASTRNIPERATTTTTMSSSSSLRYARLVSVVEKALKQSRKHFDVKQAVAQVYGDDASIFGCSSSSNKNSKSLSSKSSSKSNNDEDDDDQTSNNMLRQVFESMLDRIEEEVFEYMLHDYFVKNDAEEKFLKLEAIVEMLQRQEIQQQQMEEADKQSARLAVEAAKRPKYHRHAVVAAAATGSTAAASGASSMVAIATTADVIHLTTLQEMKAQRDALLLQVEAVEVENCKLQEKKEQRIQAHKVKGAAAQVLQQLAMELENSADVGSSFDK